MAEKKKRNKAYRPKPVWSPGREAKVYEGMQDLLRNACFIIELKLYQRTCENYDIEVLKDFFNWTSFTLMREDYLDETEKEDFAEEINEAVELMVKIIRRKTSGRFADFEAGANEVNTIAIAAHHAREYMKEQCRKRPKWMHQNYRGMLEYLRDEAPKKKGAEVGTLGEIECRKMEKEEKKQQLNRKRLKTWKQLRKDLSSASQKKSSSA